MMRVLITLFIVTTFTSFLYSQEDISDPIEFAFGSSELDSFITDNFVRPNEALLYGINAKIEVDFKIDTTGQIVDIKIKNYQRLMVPYNSSRMKFNLDSVDIKYCLEAIRVIKYSEGLWVPAEDEKHFSNLSKSLLIKIETENYEKKMDQIKSSANIMDKLSVMDQNIHSAELDIPSTSADKYYNLGVKKFNQGLYLLAIKYFNTSLKLDKNLTDSWYNLGLTYYKIGNKLRACQCWAEGYKKGDIEVLDIINKYCK